MVHAPTPHVEAVEGGVRAVPVPALLDDLAQERAGRVVIARVRSASSLVEARVEPARALGGGGPRLREPATRVGAIGILQEDAPEEVGRVLFITGSEEPPALRDERRAAVCSG
jgi:hypothetical protein